MQEIPSIGLGTLRHRGDQARDLVQLALAEGYRHVDSAEFYGNEEPVGAALMASSVPRDEVWLTTKVLHPKAPRPESVEAAVHASLGRLGVEYVDAMLIHWPNDHFELELELEALTEMRDQGLARTIGLSNFPSALLRRALELQPDLVTNQVEFHPFLSQSAVLEVTRDAGMLLTGHSPLARGAVLEDPVLVDIASAHGVSAAQVALAWAVGTDGVVVIPGASPAEEGVEEQRRRLRENLAATEVSLSTSDVERISTLHRGMRMVDGPHAPDWDA